MKILMVFTSHEKLGMTGRKTGFWFEEFVAPYYVFKDSGASITLASPLGGQPPIDAKSIPEFADTDADHRYEKDAEAHRLLANTVRLSTLSADRFDALFFPGGHGPLWDLARDPVCTRLVENFWAQGKPIGAVCHGPAALLKALTPSNEHIVKGRRVTGFTNREEEAAGLINVVPFRLEDELKARGAIFQHRDNFEPCVVQDGQLVTGQNPASSEPAAEHLVMLLTEQRRPELA